VPSGWARAARRACRVARNGFEKRPPGGMRVQGCYSRRDDVRRAGRGSRGCAPQCSALRWKLGGRRPGRAARRDRARGVRRPRAAFCLSCVRSCAIKRAAFDGGGVDRVPRAPWGPGALRPGLRARVCLRPRCVRCVARTRRGRSRELAGAAPITRGEPALAYVPGCSPFESRLGSRAIAPSLHEAEGLAVTASPGE
jgi:hypothetical protein